MRNKENLYATNLCNIHFSFVTHRTQPGLMLKNWKNESQRWDRAAKKNGEWKMGEVRKNLSLMRLTLSNRSFSFFFLLLPFYLMILKGEFHNDNNFVHDLWMNKFYGPETSQAISPVQTLISRKVGKNGSWPKHFLRDFTALLHSNIYFDFGA